MSEPAQIQNRSFRSPGLRVFGIVLAVIGILLCFAIVFPYVGLFIAVFGIVIVFVGFGLYAYGSKFKGDSNDG